MKVQGHIYCQRSKSHSSRGSIIQLVFAEQPLYVGIELGPTVMSKEKSLPALSCLGRKINIVRRNNG